MLRFLSAVAILIYHYPNFTIVGTAPANANLAELPFYQTLHLAYRSGFFAVQVFWAISGFIFHWKYEAEISNDRISFARFFSLRFSRLYPLHFATLIAVLGLQYSVLATQGSFWVYSLNDVTHLIEQLFLAGNLFRDGELSFNGPVWSVSVEVVAYCVFFYVATLKLRGVRFIATLAAIAGFLAIYVPQYRGLFSCLLFFFFGGLIYRLRRAALADQKLQNAIRRSFVGAAILLSLSGWAIPHPLAYVDAHLVVLAFIGPLLFLASEEVRVAPYVAKGARMLGNLTYSSYLLQFPIQLGLVFFFGLLGSTPPVMHRNFFCLFVGLTLTCSFICYCSFEQPAQRWLRLILLPRDESSRT